MEISSHFFVCSLQNPIDSHWFKKVLLELHGLSFFIKWWNSAKPFFFCMSKQYFCQTFFSHKNIIEIYLIYWNVLLWILSDCLAFDRNPTKFYIYLFFTYNLSTLYCYQFLMLLFGRISPGAIISHHLKTWSLGVEKGLTIWMFTMWELLFSNHKSER